MRHCLEHLILHQGEAAQHPRVRFALAPAQDVESVLEHRVCPVVEELRDSHPLRAELALLLDEERVLLGGPFGVVDRRAEVIDPALLALAHVAAGHLLSDGGPVEVAVLLDEGAKLIIFLGCELRVQSGALVVLGGREGGCW